MDTREFGYCFSSFRVTCGFRAKTIQRKSRYLVRSFPFCLFISSFIYSPLTPGPTTSDKRSNRIVVQCVKELAALTGDWLIAFAVERQQRESDSDWFCPLFFFCILFIHFYAGCIYLSASVYFWTRSRSGWNMVGEMETREKPKPSPDYLMQLMNDKKLMSSLPNFCGIFNHLERLLDEGKGVLTSRLSAPNPSQGSTV